MAMFNRFQCHSSFFNSRDFRKFCWPFGMTCDQTGWEIQESHKGMTCMYTVSADGLTQLRRSHFMKEKEIRLIVFSYNMEVRQSNGIMKKRRRVQSFKLMENTKIERQRWHSFLHVEQISGNWFNEVIGSSCYNIHTVMSKHCAL